MPPTYHLTPESLSTYNIHTVCEKRVVCISGIPRSAEEALRGGIMNSDRMFELAQALAAAKSRQDVPAALAVLHDDMLLETPAFGTSARGLAENEKVLTRFFASFPDYNVVLEGHAANDDTLVCWGR